MPVYRGGCAALVAQLVRVALLLLLLTVVKGPPANSAAAGYKVCAAQGWQVPGVGHWCCPLQGATPGRGAEPTHAGPHVERP
jgi:hypothetical protein